MVFSRGPPGRVSSRTVRSMRVPGDRSRASSRPRDLRSVVPSGWMRRQGVSLLPALRGRPTPVRPLLAVKTMRPLASYQVPASYWRMTGNWTR